MRPNTPYAVLTPTAAICHGGHYLATSCLRQTCCGFLTTFTLSSIPGLTNTEHTSEAQLLFRQMAYFFCDAYIGGIDCESSHSLDIFFSSLNSDTGQVYLLTPKPISQMSPTLMALWTSFPFATCLNLPISYTLKAIPLWD
jgi:hypothetical protein